jgi:hypothetical protein
VPGVLGVGTGKGAPRISGCGELAVTFDLASGSVEGAVSAAMTAFAGSIKFTVDGDSAGSRSAKMRVRSWSSVEGVCGMTPLIEPFLVRSAGDGEYRRVYVLDNDHGRNSDDWAEGREELGFLRARNYPQGHSSFLNGSTNLEEYVNRR